MKIKKILIIATNDLGKSGVPEVIMSIVRLLHDSFVFDILITRDNTFYKEEFESYGGHVYTIFEKEYNTRIRRFFYRTFVLRRDILNIFKLFKKNHYYAIHSFKDLEGGYYLKCAKKIGIKNRISHCSRQYIKPAKTISKIRDHILLKKIFKFSTQLVAISNVSGKSLFGDKKFEILYNTYNEKYYSFDSSHASKNLELIQIGTFLPIKNQLFSIELARIIKTVFPSFKLYFIGRIFDKKYYEKVKGLIVSYGLSNNIEILNFDTDQNSIYSRVSFSIVPSLCEGLSLTAIESQAKGITCFASTGVPEEVSCGNIVFLELDETIWANKIIECFNQTKGKRTKVDLYKFSNRRFKEKLMLIYSRQQY